MAGGGSGAGSGAGSARESSTGSGAGSDGGSDASAAPCPCGSGASYAACCAPLHAGAVAPSAERLMRSRFSAFALGLPEYLLRSWDPETRPAALELDPDLVWRRLFISDTSAGGPNDATGFVTFTAIGRGPEGRFEQRERSRFARGSDGHWRYVDGTEL